MSNQFLDWCEQVKQAAYGNWPDILQSLGGLNANQVNPKKNNLPCPVCVGDDRYSFMRSSDGNFICRKCGHGDGIEMLTRLHAWPFKMAMQEIARYLGVDPYNGQCVDPYLRKLAQEKAEQRKKEASQKQKQEDLQAAAKADQRAAYALELWNRSLPARTGHPYLDSHCLPPFDLHETQHKHYGWCLLVPLFNEQGELRNLEYIMAVSGPDGKNKKPISGAKKTGLFYRFINPSEDPTWTIYIVESWSTGAAIHLDMPNHPSVLCSMSAGNLMAVVEIALRLFPENRLVIGVDHDETGIKAAYAVAKKFGLEVALPPNPGDDFCDIHIRKAKGNKTT